MEFHFSRSIFWVLILVLVGFVVFEEEIENFGASGGKGPESPAESGIIQAVKAADLKPSAPAAPSDNVVAPPAPSQGASQEALEAAEKKYKSVISGLRAKINELESKKPAKGPGNFDYKIKFKHPEERSVPYRRVDCPGDKPLCNARVAVLMSGHVRDAVAQNKMGQIKDFLNKCRAEARSCDVFIHTWVHKQFSGKTYYGEVKQGGLVDVQRYCKELQCTSLIVERQNATNLDTDKEWGKGGIRYEGNRFAVYGNYVANIQRREYNARFGLAHDIVVRLRPDYYRVPHNHPLPSGKFRNCMSKVEAGKIYGNGPEPRRRVGFYPGGSDHRPGRQVSRPWNGNSGDNFFYGAAETMDRVLDALFLRYDEFYEPTLTWNRLNPEAQLGTVMKSLGVRAEIC